MGNKKEYLEYIHKSIEWQQKRLECFELYGKICLICKTEKKIHVHHKTYKRFKKERVKTDLVPLCDKHHKALHKYCKKKKRPLWEGSEEYLTGFTKDKKTLKRHQRLKKKKRKKAKSDCGVRQPKYYTLPNDMKNFEAIISVEI